MSIPQTVCRYVAVAWHLYVRGIPGVLLMAASCYKAPFELRNGIRVLDDHPGTRSQFVTAIGMALDLIREYDPMRFRRVRRELHKIVNVRAVFGCDYMWPLKLCAVNFHLYGAEPDHELRIKYLASALIHKATVGHLYSVGVLRKRTNLRRFDALCCREAQRFLRRLGMERTPWDDDQLGSPGCLDFWKFVVRDLK